MYRVGDYIHYGNTGVCRVADIRPVAIGSEEDQRMYYILDPLYQDCQISTPVENSKIFMRPILTREEAEQLIEKIPTMQVEIIDGKETRQLTNTYEQAINTHDCEDLVKLTMALQAKKEAFQEQNKKLGSLDESFIRRAEELLNGELAVALGIPKEEVPAYIQGRVESIRAESERAASAGSGGPSAR
ncbi:CarD family transcriptional regulator [Gorillibacterium sp. sgz500922]|uniref:CarD family transcriptional regulator n=1 Tax=Gorillibacterium sp. sgz500922 TaxID=3446694 RepID=UPI003F67CEF5